MSATIDPGQQSVSRLETDARISPAPSLNQRDRPAARAAPQPGRRRLSIDLVLAALLPLGAGVAIHLKPVAWMGGVATMLDVGAMVLALMAISIVLTGDRFGFALSSLNRYSLARTQVAAWTMIVFGSLLAAAEWNLLAVGITLDALAVTIPPTVLAALGISLFSAVATPAILSVKSANSPDATTAQMADATLRASAMTGLPTELRNANQVAGNQSSAGATWQDLVSGDDVAVTGRVDLSKVQQALLTFIVLAGYLAMAVLGFTTGAAILTLPVLGDSTTQLLAISHAGYLAYKAVPKADLGR